MVALNLRVNRRSATCLPRLPRTKFTKTSCDLWSELQFANWLARRFGSENSLQFILPFGGQDCLVRMGLGILDPTRASATVSVVCRWPEYLGAFAAFTVRLYHDMQLAEVTDESSSDFIQGAYPYPNPSMVQPNEREQLDQFLSEWLSYCLHHGLADLSAYGIDTNELSGTGY